jgi:endonuclease/exonuclease/phosphatase family metal-dependent hydrolase
VASISHPAGDDLTVVSLYGLWEHDDKYLYAEGSLHRAISDLTPPLQTREAVVLAGDLNIWSDWSQGADRWWAPRFDTVFTRLAAYGLDLVGPQGEGPLAGCKCGGGADCRHGGTYRHQRKAEWSNQLDFVFASAKLAPGATCRLLKDDEMWQHSDHGVVITNVPWPAAT